VAIMIFMLIAFEKTMIPMITNSRAGR
jgi:hypothetical protein